MAVAPALCEMHALACPSSSIAAVAAPDAGSALAQVLSSLAPALRHAHVEAAVLCVVQELTGAADAALEVETPLMEAGVDSLAATELSSRLRSLTGVALSPTIVFEQPTPRAVASHLLEQVAGADPEVTVMVGGVESGSALALEAMHGRWPGACDNEAARWRLQRACGDALSAVPATRWTIELAVDVRLLSATQLQCVQNGGFVRGAERFDNLAFGISSAEAGAMDPQQRLLLDVGYAALHASFHRRATLMGGDSGVFLGIERPDWGLAQPPQQGAGGGGRGACEGGQGLMQPLVHLRCIGGAWRRRRRRRGGVRQVYK